MEPNEYVTDPQKIYDLMADTFSGEDYLDGWSTLRDAMEKDNG